MRWPQFSLIRLCGATALSVIPFALMKEFPHQPVWLLVVVSGYLWGCAFGLLAAQSLSRVLYFGLSGIAVFAVWACIAVGIDWYWPPSPVLVPNALPVANRP